MYILYYIKVSVEMLNRGGYRISEMAEGWGVRGGGGVRACVRHYFPLYEVWGSPKRAPGPPPPIRP